jgi:hypothetical protein
LADVLDATNLQVVLKDSISCNSFTLGLIINFAKTGLSLLTRQISHDSFVSGLIILIQHDEFIRHDSHLLKSNGLSLSTREAFNDPTLLAVFHLLDLLLDKFDHDFIADVTVSSERLFNVFTKLLVFLSDLAGDQISD